MNFERSLDVEPFADRRRFDPVGGTLTGGQCAACGAQAWPRRAVCHRCGSGSIDEWVLPDEGTLETWSRVWVGLPGLEPPYQVGIVRLGDARIFSHVSSDGDVATPARVVVELEPANDPFFRVRVVDERGDHDGNAGGRT